MSTLFKVTVNGQSIIVDAPTKAIAKAHGKTLVKVDVAGVSASELAGLDVSTIPVLTAKSPKVAEAAEGAEGAAE